MVYLLETIWECLLGAKNSDEENASKEKEIIADVLRALLSAEKGGKIFKQTMDNLVGEYGWTENIAKAILGATENALKQGAHMGQAMKDASEKAIDEAAEFAHDHPYFTALIAVGILVILMPWVLEALGFAELGPVEGSFAAWWESTYSGYVTRKSLFSFFQRLGMVWRRYPSKSVL